MQGVLDLIDRSLILINLGSYQDDPIPLPPELREAVTLLRLDGFDPGEDDGQYARLIAVKDIVAPEPGPRLFMKRVYPNCSSLLDPNERLIKAFGLERYYELQEAVPVEAVTLAMLLERHGLPRFDYLKTDLEGLDLAVVESAANLLPACVMVAMETRAQPFYHGEATLAQILGFMDHHGFTLHTLQPEVWKYRTSHRDHTTEGRFAMADALFIKRPEVIREHHRQAAPAALLRQVLLLWMRRQRSTAEFILENHLPDVPAALRNELAAAMFADVAEAPPILNPMFPHVGRPA